tara:strand:+ start:342 stop:545 length:204 start_codon:yes stop_codon:yes gene_type:complete
MNFVLWLIQVNISKFQKNELKKQTLNFKLVASRLNIFDDLQEETKGTNYSSTFPFVLIKEFKSNFLL